jgi:hypothetical protein
VAREVLRRHAGWRRVEGEVPVFSVSLIELWGSRGVERGASSNGESGAPDLGVIGLVPDIGGVEGKRGGDGVFPTAAELVVLLVEAERLSLRAYL